MTRPTDKDDELERRRLTRRGFVRATAVSVAALGAGGGASLSTRALAAPPPKGGTTRYPLRLPPTILSPSGLALEARPTVSDLGGGSSNVWAYNGSFPGPSIVARRGETVSIRLVNGLSEQTVTHWHGLIVGEVNDGGVWYAIPPDAVFDYEFRVDQRAGLSFYHPHPHMLTGKQVNLGLAGAFIVRDAVDDGLGGLGLPYGTHEVPLIVRDATLDNAGNLQYKPRTGGFDGQIPLVNGTRSPHLNVDSDVYRFRVLNGANARIFGLGLSNGAPFRLIGNDGGLLETFTDLTRIDIAPADRLDLLVSFAGLSVGESVMLRDLRAGWDLLELRRVAGGAGESVPSPALSAIAKLSGPSAPTRVFSFDGMSKINGRLFDHDRIDFEVPFGQTERWRFVTGGNAPHPVHVHGASFQVQSRAGGRGQVFPWERGWKDSVLLEDRESVEVLIRFDAEVNRGSRYLLHCHKLEHEDMGMMAAFRVV